MKRCLAGVCLLSFMVACASSRAGDGLRKDAEPRTIEHALHERSGQPHLELLVGGKRVISPDVAPLFAETDCEVNVRAEAIEEGVLLHLTIRNQADERAPLPVIRVPGIKLPRHGFEILDNWKNVHFREPLAQRQQHLLHAMRSYPAASYSPVMGMKHEDIFIATAMLYEVFNVRREVNMDYRFDRRSGTWAMEYRLWDDRPERVDDRPTQPPMATLAPGEAIELTIAVTAASPESWLTAFRPYRDFFQKSYGHVRHKRSNEPIYAISLGHTGWLSDANPKGYGTGGIAGYGRMDRVGWLGLFAHSRDEIRARGFRRAMIWQVAGSYRGPGNMVWEITSSWEPVMNRTTEELTRAIEEGLEVGFWWGRAMSISGGFNTGIRVPWNPDNVEHNEAAFRELDRAYELGVRLIGLDATPRSIFSADWTPPSDVLYKRILPMLHERYPEMRWIIEPAPCDYLHLWGSSFMWSREVHGPFEFAQYIAPGSESHAVMKRDRPPAGQETQHDHMTQDELDQFIKWGYTPIVFSADRYRLRVKRDLLAE